MKETQLVNVVCDIIPRFEENPEVIWRAFFCLHTACSSQRKAQAGSVIVVLIANSVCISCVIIFPSSLVIQVVEYNSLIHNCVVQM
jgi:hypothetical protein